MDTTITGLPTAATIDSAQDWIPIDTTSLGTTQKINRDTFLGITGAPLGTTDSQSVSNKSIGNTNTVTLKDTLFTLQDDGDTTKQAQFNLSGITTATTRTYTLPNASSTIADLSTAQTFTNKTLTSPTITGGSISNTSIAVNSIAEFTAANGVSIDGLNIKDAKLNTNDSVVAANITESAVTPAKLFTGTGSTWAWSSWTPTFTNISGGTLNYAKYIQTGKTVICRLKYTFAGTGMGSSPYFTLPVTANSDYTGNDSGETYLGTVSLVDATVSYYIGLVVQRSTTSVFLRYQSSAAQMIGITATAPFTWNTGDFIQMHFVYEAA